MPRRPRLALPGVPLHLIQRGNNRQACFFAEEDCRFYLEWLTEYAGKTGFRLHAYVLMTKGIPKIMAFFDLPEIRAANEHLLKTDLSLLTKLVFLPPGQAPTNLEYVHGVYISIEA